MDKSGVELIKTWQGGWSVEPDSHRRVCYSRFNPEWMRQFGIQPAVIFDVGAYDGADSIRLKRAFPSARVVSIEGDPIRAAAIRKAIVGHDIIFVESIVLDKVGMSDWYQGGDRSEYGTKNGSVYRWEKKPPGTPESHPCTTLLSICEDNGIKEIDLLHIDIEGAEIFALRGLDPISPRVIWAELADAWPDAPGSRATHKEITGRGYKHIWSSGSDRLYVRDAAWK